jgi:hypothetical protein
VKTGAGFPPSRLRAPTGSLVSWLAALYGIALYIDTWGKKKSYSGHFRYPGARVCDMGPMDLGANLAVVFGALDV